MSERSPCRVASIALAVACVMSGCAESGPSSGERPASSSLSGPRAGTTVAPPRRPAGPVARGWQVVDVVDGDTVTVERSGRRLTVRLIGIDTPETVDPSRPVECFGPEATAFAQRRLAGARVWLEFDPSQGRRDVYGRTLAYVWPERPGGGRSLFNLRAVRRGYAVEFTDDRDYRWRDAFRNAELRAASTQVGLWSPSTCGGSA